MPDSNRDRMVKVPPRMADKWIRSLYQGICVDTR